MSRSRSKPCFKCGVEKPLSEFYRHKNMADGHFNKCKECAKADEKADRERNPEKFAARERARSQTPRRKAQRKRYLAAYHARHPGRAVANHAVGNAVRDGHLEKGPCEVCGVTEVQAHHDDYGKPLKVRWLCREHHREADAELRQQIPAPF